MRAGRMLSLGGAAIAAAAAMAFGAATNDNSSRHRLLADDHQHQGVLARRGLSQQQDEAAFGDQLQDELTSTTIATTRSTILISTDMTQAFDNPQDPNWMIDSPNNGSTTATTSNGNSSTSYSNNNNNNTTTNDLISLASNQQQHLFQPQQQQQSFNDWWQEYWSRQPFPSGYTQLSITLVACLLTTIIFLIVVGNLLVCIAIFTEKSLKPVQNWFIASLAVSDMLLGLVVMPFSLARELMGFWIFGPLWCDIHEALDVLLTTASINFLCLISLDRYWSITQAVSYLKKRTPRRAVFMIAFVWVFSAAVCLPPLFGWKKQSPVMTAPAIGSNSTRAQKKQQQLPAKSQQREQQQQQLARSDDTFESRGDDSTRAGSDDGESGDGQEKQWQQKRRRRHHPDRESPQSRPSPPPATLLPASPSFIPSLAGRQFVREDNEDDDHLEDIPANLPQQQQPVIAYAYLSSELQPQLQLEQQLTNEYPTCQLSDDVGYVLYSALGSFFIPCAVMVFTYIKIGLAARKRARRAIDKQARAHQTGGQGGGKRGAGGGQHRRALASTTSGRTGKQLPIGDSTLLLTPTLTTGCATNDNQFPDEDDPDQVMPAQRRPKSAHHHHRNSRAAGLTAESVRNSTPTPPMMGKLVVVERQKAGPTPTGAGISPTEQQEVQRTSSSAAATAVASQETAAATTTSPISPETGSDQDSACCAATLITSGSKLASPSALRCSSSCGGISAMQQQQQQQQPEQPNDKSEQRRFGRQDRKQTSESNDSSLITVMSASMNELPQVTRFNFTPKQSDQVVEDQVMVGTRQVPEDEKLRAAALLRAISRAGHELANDDTLVEVIARDGDDDNKDAGSCQPNPSETTGHVESDEKAIAKQRESDDKSKQAGNNSTNETCFMTIEEDSDHLEAQTGRTIMMIASTAKQSSCSLAGKSQVGMMMTMLPPASGTTAASGQQQNDASTIVCNNVACLRRHARRQANRRGLSYCGSSMTINDDEEEDEEEEEDDDEEEDEIIANGGDSVDDDEEDECLEDDLLTDDCNGYSGSCRLDPYCTATASSTCTHCRECAALSGRVPVSGECPHDSPLSCTYNYSKSTPQDSPQIHGTSGGGCVPHLQGSSNQQNKRTRRFVCHHNHSSSALNSQDRLGCNMSEIEAQSLTGDDNLSLTDYYRSNEDNSSIIGHDVLDATPAREHPGPKRRSIVASAIASVGGGLNRMTSGGGGGACGAAGGNQLQQHQPTQQQPGQVLVGTMDGRKKSSIGFHLSRFGSSGGGANILNPPARSGLVALAAASQQQQQQQQQQQLGVANPTRNLKTLRQNFFHKLNQLTAKSAAKQDGNKLSSRSPTCGKSSAHSSYGSSYEPSVDCATASNLYSTNDHYQMETTFGETDDYEQQTSAETTKQSSDQMSSGGAGGPNSPAGKLMSIAQQAAAAAAAAASANTSTAAAAARHSSGHSVTRPNEAQPRANQRQKADPTINSVDINNNNNPSKQMQPMGAADEEGSNTLAQSSSQISLTMEGERNLQSCNVNEGPITAKSSRDHEFKALVGAGHPGPTKTSSDLKRRSNDKTVALACSSQGSGSDQRPTGTNTTFRQGAGGAGSGGGGNVISKAFLASDNDRHKRKLAKARERRATLILGLIMFTFISCWFPFFTFYVLRAVCHVCRDYIPPRLEAFIFWMGYCNSAINPIIYTIFNRDFRKAFRKILFRCSRD